MKQCDAWITKFGFCQNPARHRVRFKIHPGKPHADVYYICAPCYDVGMATGKYVDLDLEER